MNIKKMGINQLLPEILKKVFLINLPVNHISKLTIVPINKIMLRSPALIKIL